jgi:50S ribosomal protein L16 3-hydroxylase
VNLGLSPAAFLRRHWQREPLLVRAALPSFKGIVDRRALFSLATRPDVTSRLVIDHGPRRARRWERHDGPFAGLSEKVLPESRWTLLVHGIESLVPGGWELLRAFDFLPAARIDDLMVSYAAPGGSVGPHDDRYDVFLLQGRGRRRWSIARGGDRALDPRAGVKVLARFEAEEEHVLAPGDMLYVPPGVAHHGVAEEACFTYSIGFLAPAEKDLVPAFLTWAAGALELDEQALYRDPGLVPARDALTVPSRMVEWARAVLDRAVLRRLDRRLMEDFLGCFLTRPRPSVRFTPGRKWARARRVSLALPTRALWQDERLYLNGRAYALPATKRRALDPLVRKRTMPWPPRADLDELLAEWLREGWIELR